MDVFAWQVLRETGHLKTVAEFIRDLELMCLWKFEAIELPPVQVILAGTDSVAAGKV
jgi:hypothetical protein